MMEPAPRNDVFSCKEAEALVNTVNCVGIMGRGIAVKFKKVFPDNFRVYAEACKKGEMRLGQVLVHDRHGNFDLFTAPENPRWIINFPTKMHWRSRSCIEDIEAGLDSLVEAVRLRGMRSIAVPALGCGLGGLDWREVRPRIERAFDALPGVRVYLCGPGREEPGSTPGRWPRLAPASGIPGSCGKIAESGNLSIPVMLRGKAAIAANDTTNQYTTYDIEEEI